MAVASLVLGIVGLVISCIPCLGAYGLILTVPGLVLSAVALKKSKTIPNTKGMSIAGLVLSIVGVILGIYWVFCIYAVKSAAEDFSKTMDDMNKISAEMGKAADDATAEMSKKIKDDISIEMLKNLK